MSDASAARSTVSRPTRSFIPYAGSGFASVLLAKTLRSSTLRLALTYIGVFGVIILGLLTYIYWSTASYVVSRADRGMAADLVALHKAYDEAGRAGLVTAIEQRVANARLIGGLYLLADPSLVPVAGNLAAWPPALKAERGSASFTDDARNPNAASLLRAHFATLPDGYRLLVGRDIDDFDAFASRIKAALGLVVAMIVVLAGLAIIAITRRTVGRIESVNATSRAIMQSGLGERIPLRGTRDEWDQLAGNLNSMLDRIEELMAEVKQVTDNVAHDLRTPLARIRGRLEKASARPRDAGDDQTLINDVMADLDGVLRMFASLTRISQIEARDRTAAFRTVDLAEIAREVVELFDAAAEDKSVHLTAAGDRRVLVMGDRDLLFDAVANLVDNAIKHGRAAGVVTVEVVRNGGGAVISVADDGPGIPAYEFQHVLKRFYRLERSRRTPGNGLGLSLIAAVARLHGARIEMIDNAPGLRFRLHFPLPAEAALENRVVPAAAGG